jgi:NitT/TauT family transport system substrate-binding protein
MKLAVLRLVALGAAAGLSAASAQTTVGVGMTNVSSDAGFFIADKKGYFRDEGIAVTMTPFASAAKMIAPLGTGQLEVGGGTVAAGMATNTRRCWCARIWPTAGATSRWPISRE